MNIGRYEIRGELGRGGMGAVLLGYDPLLERKVAIKCVRTDAASDVVEQRELERRLIREAQSAAKLTHAGIVGIYDVIQTEGGAYIVMEFVSGRTLAEVVPAGVRADPAFVARVLSEAATALDQAHARNIIHRDIKPGNIMLDETQAVKIADFGIAKMAGMATHTSPGVVVGTLAYMSPEQLQGGPLDGRADQYSLAVVGYQMLAGRSMYDAETLAVLAVKIAAEVPPPLTRWNPTLPAAVDAVFAKALSKNPQDRFATCSQFAAAVHGALAFKEPKLPRIMGPPMDASSKPGDAFPLPGVSAMAPALRRYLPIVGAFAAISAAIIGATFYFTRPRTSPPAASPTESTAAPAASGTESRVSLPATAPAAAESGPPASPSPAQVWQNAKDHQAYLWIPPGSLIAGCVAGDHACEPAEKPAREVAIRQGFWMGQTEASVAAYSNFARATNRSMPPAPSFDPNWSGQDHPMVQVTWQEAADFCSWAGGRLPSEEEWEYAARGGVQGQVFPTGDQITPSDAHFAGDGGPEGTVAIMNFRPNGFGLHQMSGNAAEWTLGQLGDRRVVRGGSWNTYPEGLRVSKRVAVDPERRTFAFGMRCVVP